MNTHNERTLPLPALDAAALEVDIVIPVHNRVYWVTWCLAELFRYPPRLPGKVIVVDDRSDPAQAERLEIILQSFPGVELVKNVDANGGFGYACNLGQSHSSAPLIVFLNTDCFLTEGAIDRLAAIFQNDPEVALVCPISNNSPELTLPMLPGLSYREMARICREATTASPEAFVMEACTIVGNCLMVRSDVFTRAGGFSDEWGTGYGEETDLQMKALGMGYKGVVDLGSYVFHFGGGTFNYEREIDEQRRKNYSLFMSKWGPEYKALAKRAARKDPIRHIRSALLKSSRDMEKGVTLDILFYLPGVNQSVGGLNVVIELCNELIRGGIKAGCALVGLSSNIGLANYKEPILFNFLYYVSDNEFLKDKRTFPKIVVSTIFASCEIVERFARGRGALAVQLVQGYEGYFENGTRYMEAIGSYQKSNVIVTTSNWLKGMVRRNLTPAHQVHQGLPPTNPDIFFPSRHVEKVYDVCLVLRSSPDKGQYLLMEIVNTLCRESAFKLLVLHADVYSKTLGRLEGEFQGIQLPLDKYALAACFRQSRVFVDASLHEGFGLMPLEAKLCGCRLVVSDSGGIRDFATPPTDAILPLTASPDQFIATIREFVEEKPAETGNYSPTILPHADLQKVFFDILEGHARNIRAGEIHYIPMALTQALEPSLSMRKFVFDVSSRAYRKIYRFIPERVHKALRMLVLGR